ncbi:Imm1 family immunity protein [Kroppenstedtia eburnea]|uniref:Imm1 family immunity protein n=1 Tax=Kroppenstedtia eburnea TaxID=714067 RepID=UPI003645C007
MFQWKLNIEGKSKVIHNPSWEEVYNVLKSMDGDEVTQADLESEDLGFLMVCGGDYIEERDERAYCVEYYPKNGNETFELVNPLVDTEDEYLFITVEKVGVDHPAETCVDFKSVVQAFQHFYKTGKLDDNLIWE